MRVKKRVKRRVKKGIKRVKSAPPEAYLAGAGVLLIGAAFVARFLPARPEPPLDLTDLEHELALEPLTTTPNHEHDSGMVHSSND